MSVGLKDRQRSSVRPYAHFKKTFNRREASAPRASTTADMSSKRLASRPRQVCGLLFAEGDELAVDGHQVQLTGVDFLLRSVGDFGSGRCARGDESV